MKKLAASISFAVIVSMMVFVVPIFASGSVTAAATSNYNTDGTMTPSSNTTTTNNLNKVDPYGSYYNSTTNNGNVTPPSVSPRLNTYGTTTPNTLNYGTRSYDTANRNLYRARAVATTTGTRYNWGWLGLLGLIGLAGLRNKDRERT